MKRPAHNFYIGNLCVLKIEKMTKLDSLMLFGCYGPPIQVIESQFKYVSETFFKPRIRSMINFNSTLGR